MRKDESFVETASLALLKAFAEAVEGSPVRGNKSRQIRAIHACIEDPARLRAVVEPLSQEAREALDLLCEAAITIPEKLLEQELRATLRESRANQALAELTAAKLIIVATTNQGNRQYGTYPPLAEALKPLFDAWYQPPSLAEPGSRTPSRGLSFVASVLLAYIANNRPQLTQQGCLYARERKKLDELVGKGREGTIDSAYDELLSLELVENADDQRLTVCDRSAVPFLSLAASEQHAEIWRTKLGQLDASRRHALSFFLRRPGWHRIQNGCRAILVALLRDQANRPWSWSSFYWSLPDEATNELWKWVGWQLLERHPDGEHVRIQPELVRFLRGTQAETAAGTESSPSCLVQPSFDVIIPPEATPLDIYRVGRVCELRKLDAVAAYAITASSVRNAVQQGFGVEALINDLRGAATHGLPPNVERGFRDFAADIKSVHLFKGTLVYFPEVPVDGRQPITGVSSTDLPGFFVGDFRDYDKIRQRLEKAGHSVIRPQAPAAAPKSSHRARPESGREGRHTSRRDGSIDEAIAIWNQITTRAERNTERQPPPLLPKPASPDQAVGGGDALFRAAREIDCSVEELQLLWLALREASQTWWHHIVPRSRERVRRAISQDQIAALAKTPDLFGELLEFAEQGCDCCGGKNILMGPAVLRTAIEKNRDLWLWPLGATEPLRFAPHGLRTRGAEVFVEGHIAGTTEDRAYGTGDIHIALGPLTAGEDLDRAGRSAATPIRNKFTNTKIGRNAPCPCGSGKKHKKCCLTKSQVGVAQR